MKNSLFKTTTKTQNNQQNQTTTETQEEETKSKYFEFKNGIYYIHPSTDKSLYLTKMVLIDRSITFRFQEKMNSFLKQNQMFYFYKDEDSKTYTIFTIENPHCLGVDRQKCFLNNDISPQNLSLLNSCRWKFVKTENENEFYLELQENKMLLGEKKINFKTNTFDSHKIALQTDEHVLKIQVTKIENLQSLFDEDIHVWEWINRAEKMKTTFMQTELNLEGEHNVITRIGMLYYQNLKKIVIDGDVKNKNIEKGCFDHLNIESVECKFKVFKNHFTSERHKKSIKEIKLLFVKETEDLKCLEDFVNLKTIEIGEYIDSFIEIKNENIRHVIAHPKFFSYFNKQFIEQLTIPTWVKDVDILKEDYLKGYSKLTSLIIPNSIEDCDSFNDLSKYLEHVECNVSLLPKIACSSVTSLHIGEKYGEIQKDHMSLFKQLKKLTITGGKRIFKTAFDDCSQLTEVCCSPDAIDLFEKRNIEKITVIDNIKTLEKPNDSIVDKTISNEIRTSIVTMKSLKQINLPQSIKSFQEENLFTKCLSLTNVKCNYNMLDQFNPNNLSELEINEGCQTIFEKDFLNKTNLTKIILPNSLTLIENFNTFEKLTSIKSVQCKPKFLKYFNLDYLTEYFAPDGVTGILTEDVKACANLCSIHLPESIVYIQPDAFSFCKRIVELDCNPKWFHRFNIFEMKIPSKITHITEGMYNEWNTISRYIIEGNNTIIDERAFEGCASLKEVEMNGTFSEVKNEAFMNCVSLEKLTVKGKIYQITIDAFTGCKKLKHFDCSDDLKQLFRRELRIEKWKIVKSVDYCQYPNIISLIIPNSTILVDPENFFNIFQNLKSICCRAEYLPYINDSIKEKIKMIFLDKQQTKVEVEHLNGFKNVELIYLPLLIEDTLDEDEKEVNPFSNLKNVISLKCRRRQLKYFDKSKLKTLVIQGEEEIHNYPNDTDFNKCKNLERVILPMDYMKEASIYFRNCYKLKLIEFSSGQKELYRLPFTVPENKINIKSNDFSEIQNVDELTLHEKIKSIETGSFDHMIEIEKFMGDSKWLQNIPLGKLECIIVPSYVKTIDLTSFNNCIMLKELHIENPSVNFIVDKESLENEEKLKKFKDVVSHSLHIKTLRCSFDVLKTLLQKVPYFVYYVESIHILEGTTIIDSDNIFNKFKELKEVHLPKSIVTICDLAFYKCNKLIRLTTEGDVNEISFVSIKYCPLLQSLRCTLEFLNKTVFDNSILQLEIIGDFEELHDYDVKKYQNLVQLALPSSTTKIPSNLFDICPKLNSLSCQYSIYEKLDDKIKKEKLKLARFPFDENKLPVVNNLYEISDFEQQNKMYEKDKKCLSAFDVCKILEKDSKEKHYIPYLIFILTNSKCYTTEEINPTSEEITYNSSLDKKTKERLQDVATNISNMLYDLFFKDRTYKPYPVQVYAILRMVYEIQYGNVIDKYNPKWREKFRTIAEVKTGEGKSLIIALTSLILAKCYDRYIDIITQNISLARRDQEFASQFFERKKVSSDVLYNIKNDLQSIKPTLRDYFMKIKNSFKWRTYNTDAFEKQIVYSTNSNFEHVHLKELFSPHRLREVVSKKTGNIINRPFDVVIIDEVDNMLIDQHSTPTTLYQQIETNYSSDILSLVYEFQDESIEDIGRILNYYFKDGANFTMDDIVKMKYAAQKSHMLEKGIDYVVEKIKKEKDIEIKDDDEDEMDYKVIEVIENEIIMIDNTTGYKMPKQQMDDYLHEMLQIKENIEVRTPRLPCATITHSQYVKLYNSIGGVTGTIGDKNDLYFMENEYKITPFVVPRHHISKKKITEQKRLADESEMMKQIKVEADEVSGRTVNGIEVDSVEVDKNIPRSVLIIVDSMKRLKKLKQTFEECQVITGLDGEEDKKAIAKAGNPRVITIATIAAGRGIDIKLSEQTFKNGGLHVIVPFKLPTRRLFEQAIGRSGRQGQPGSATVYCDLNDEYEIPVPSDNRMDMLQEIQRLFSYHLKNSDEFKWTLYFEYNSEKKFFRRFKSHQKFPFGIGRKDFFKLFNAFIENRTMTFSDWFKYTTYIREMVMISWSIFFNEMIEKLKTKSEDIKTTNDIIDEYYIFIEELIENIPQRYTSKSDYVSTIIETEFKSINWKKHVKTVVTVLGVNVLGAVITSQFGPVAGAVYQLASGFIVDMGFDIATILMNGGKIDWKSFVSILKKRSKELVKDTLITVATFSVANALSDVVCSTVDQITHSIGLTDKIKDDTTLMIFDKVKEYYVEESVDTFMDLIVEPAIAVGFWVVRGIRTAIDKATERKEIVEDEEINEFAKDVITHQNRIKKDFIKETLSNQFVYSNTPNAIVPITHRMRLSLVLKLIGEAKRNKKTKYIMQSDFALTQNKLQIERAQFDLLLLKQKYGFGVEIKDNMTFSKNNDEIEKLIEDTENDILEIKTNYYRDKILKKGLLALDNFFKRRFFNLISKEEFDITMAKLGLPAVEEVQETLDILTQSLHESFAIK